MAPAAAAIPAALLLSLLLYSAAATDIVSLLSQNSDFTSFANILSQTGLDAEINHRQTITVLAVPNSELDAVSGRPLDVVKKIISVHVVLDYYDADKLAKLSKKTALLTTLFQTTGQASGQSGFLNVTDLPDGKVAFGSAVAGAGLDVYLTKSMVSQPYNISVLEVTGLIVPPGIEDKTPAAAAPKKADAPAATTAASPKPSTTSAAAPSKTASAPTKTAAAPTKASPSPSDATTAPSSDDASAPTAKASSAPAAEGPAASGNSADTPAGTADATAPAASSASRAVVGAGLAVAVGAAFFGAL